MGHYDGSLAIGVFVACSSDHIGSRPSHEGEFDRAVGCVTIVVTPAD